MSAKQVDNLVKMAEQIALNLGAAHDGAAARRIAEHLGRFWTPAMCRQLTAFWREGGKVSAVVAAALQELQELDEQQQRGAS